MGQCEQLLKPIVGKLEHLQNLIAGQSFAALEYLLTGLSENVLCHEGQVSAPGSADQNPVDPLVTVPPAHTDDTSRQVDTVPHHGQCRADLVGA